MFRKLSTVLIAAITSTGISLDLNQNNDIKPFPLSPFAATHYTSDVTTQEFTDPFFYLDQYNTQYQTANPWKNNRYETIYEFKNEYETPKEAFKNRPHPKYPEDKKFYHATITKFWFNNEHPKDDLWIHENMTAQELPSDPVDLKNFLKNHDFLKSQEFIDKNPHVVLLTGEIIPPKKLLSEALEPKWESFIAPIELIDNHPVSPRRHYCLPEVSYTTKGYLNNNLLLNVYDRGSELGKIHALNLHLLYDKSCIDDFINPNRIKDFNLVFYYRTGNKDHIALNHIMFLQLLQHPVSNDPVELHINEYDRKNCGIVNSFFTKNEFVLKTWSDNMNDLSVKYDLIQRFIDPVCQLAYSFSNRIRENLYDHYIFKPNQFGTYIDYDMLIAYDDQTIKISSRNGEFSLNKRLDLNGNIYNSINKDIFYIPRNFNKKISIKVKLISTRTFIPFEKIVSFNAELRGEI